VKQVFAVASGVAVLGEHTWAALAGRDMLKVVWDEGPAAQASSAGIKAQFAKRLETPGKTVRKEGKGAAGLEGAAKRLKAAYDFPFLAHATMEPMVATADVKADRCDIYAPTQAVGLWMPMIMAATGLKAEQIEVHIPLLGGGFGRRAMPDFIMDAVECSKKAGAPVKVQWSREDDMQHDWYRPATLHQLEGGLNAKGDLAAWNHRFAGGSIAASLHFPWPPEATEISGAADLPYAIPDLEVEWAQSDVPVPLGFWRAVPASFNPFASECFFDELAHAAGKDPLAWRLEMLKGEGKRKVGQESVDLGRLRKVLETVRDQSGWTTAKFRKGRGHGVAAHAYLDCDTYVAEVAEVEVKADGSIRVLRVVCAVDCGYAVNPENVKAQMEGGILYGLSAALFGEITVDKGRVVQGSYKDYPVARMAHMPKVEVHIVAHPDFVPPGGVGEPGLPPLAPAVGNAVFHATGKRLRSLPMTQDKVRQA
jgi:CO/xanthine dehydrogenase Mo-binding subunit